MTPEDHNLALDGEGRTLHLVEAGAGQTFVLIHGALTTHTDWLGTLFDGFASRGRAIALDRPGHGASRRPRYQASPLQQADQIREGLRQLGVERPILVGHSFGGIVALAWAAAYPDEVAGLVLAAPIAFQEFRFLEHPFFGPRALPLIGPWLSEAARISLDPMLLKLAHKIMFAPHLPPPDWLARYPYARILTAAQMLEEGEDANSVFPGSPTSLIDYRAIRAPTRILAGEMDQVVYPVRHAKRLAAILPDAELTVRLDVGHMLHHTASDGLFQIIDDLMRSSVTGPAAA